MKKLLLIGAFAVISSFTFADGDSAGDIMEDRLEINFMNTLGKDADIDMNIFNKKANIEIEYDGKSIPESVDVELVSEEIATFVSEETDATDIFITFKVDPVFGDEEVVYSKTFKKN